MLVPRDDSKIKVKRIDAEILEMRKNQSGESCYFVFSLKHQLPIDAKGMSLVRNKCLEKDIKGGILKKYSVLIEAVYFLI